MKRPLSLVALGVGAAVFSLLFLSLLSPFARGQTPAPSPALIPGPIGSAESSAAGLYHQALADKDAARRSAGELSARKAGGDLLRQLVVDYPQTSLADNAHLRLVEDGFCLTDAGYPDCAALAIRGYEGFLAAYPYSDRKAYVLQRLAAGYLDLSFRYEEDRPWRSSERAELCLGRSLQLAETLAARSESEAGFGRELAVRIRASGRSFSVVPGSPGLPAGD